MLEIRSSCEHCNTDLPFNSDQAMICTYECTFCRDCVQQLLKEVCPNCGGNFAVRPIRPEQQLVKYPASKKCVHKPVDLVAHYKKHNLE